MNLGGRATIDFGKGRSASVLVGRTYRARAGRGVHAPVGPARHGVRLRGRRDAVAGMGRLLLQPLAPGRRHAERAPGRGGGELLHPPASRPPSATHYEQSGLVQVQCTGGICPDERRVQRDRPGGEPSPSPATPMITKNYRRAGQRQTRDLTGARDHRLGRPGAPGAVSGGAIGTSSTSTSAFAWMCSTPTTKPMSRRSAPPIRWGYA